MIRNNKPIQSKSSNPPRAATLPEAQGLLRSQGKRITGQRTLLLQLIRESKEHLDAEALYRRAKKRDPRLNLATVYRTLNLLKAADLIEPSHLTHDHRREHFESKPAAEHYHFTCLGCGSVIEFESALVEQLRREVKQKFNVELTHDCVCFEGYCVSCQRQRK